MKRILFFIATILLVSNCTNEDLIAPTPAGEVSQSLKITSKVGIKVETPFVTEDVSMNVKAEIAGTYIVKILNIANKPVSKEEVNIQAGNNVLKIYTKALPSSAYRIGLYDLSGNLLGITDFNKL